MRALSAGMDGLWIVLTVGTFYGIGWLIAVLTGLVYGVFIFSLVVFAAIALKSPEQLRSDERIVSSELLEREYQKQKRWSSLVVRTIGPSLALQYQDSTLASIVVLCNAILLLYNNKCYVSKIKEREGLR